MPLDHLAYRDFAIEVTPQDAATYQIAVRSSAGETQGVATFPYTNAQLELELLRLEQAILYAQTTTRLRLLPHEEAVRDFGARLFAFLLPDEVRSLYYECQREAQSIGQGVRIKLIMHAPHLAALPWEFLHDPRRRDYVALDPRTPLVRYPALAQSAPPLPVTPPLRILGVVANPADLRQLNAAQEQRQVETALQPLLVRGLVELTWLPGQSWRDLQQWMRPSYGPWHILHLIGHGEFDQRRDEGRIFLADDEGRAQGVSATQLSRLLAFQRGTLRLAVLNACEGARGGRLDVLSGTAATLVAGGLPAVLAMQYAITDAGALEFARTFYSALADNLPVDAAVADARNAMNLHDESSLEWGTPVLYLRATDGRLFDLANPPMPARPPVNITVTAGPAEAVATRPAPPRTPVAFDWVTIPAGEFVMGSDKEKDKDAFDDELPQFRLNLPEYQIARYPVTVAQFAQFITATNYQTTAEQQGYAYGYTGSKWKVIMGAYWVRPRGPKSTIEQKMEHPVTCISWADAVAFCHWAKVRLPTEAEWEKAARGGDGRLYPWGNAPPDATRCNFAMNVKDTTPVGHYPVGISPYGCYDMAGNVLEWTSSLWGRDIQKPDFGYPYVPTDGREDSVAGGYRVVRGGSFDAHLRGVRCAVRGGIDLGIVLVFDRVGFRVAWSPG
ncbi:MAG: SUMF1/EgtB/PvdO family nonheme iron enzyme [Caldilineaceae bacterium]